MCVCVCVCVCQCGLSFDNHKGDDVDFWFRGGERVMLCCVVLCCVVLCCVVLCCVVLCCVVLPCCVSVTYSTHAAMLLL